MPLVINIAQQISRFQVQESSHLPMFLKVVANRSTLKSSTLNHPASLWRCITLMIQSATLPAHLLTTDFFASSLSISQLRTQSSRLTTVALKISLKRSTKQSSRRNLMQLVSGMSTVSSMTWSRCHFAWRVATFGLARITTVMCSQIPSHRVMAHLG